MQDVVLHYQSIATGVEHSLHTQIQLLSSYTHRTLRALKKEASLADSIQEWQNGIPYSGLLILVQRELNKRRAGQIYWPEFMEECHGP